MKKLNYAVFAFLLLLFGCAQNSETENDGKLTVVTTVGMISDIVKEVGGDDVVVHGLMGPGVDPHLYQASEGDVAKLARADIIFYNGLHLEAKMGEIFEKMETSKTTVPVTKKIPMEQLLDFEGYPGLKDPHVWFDVELWMKSVEQVRDTLMEKDPGNAAKYRKRSDEYLIKLKETDEYVMGQANKIPKEQRVLITAHDAFKYFSRAYDFEVIGLQGISTEAEAGTKDIQNLADIVVERKIKAIFVESSVSERNIKAVQEAVKSKGWEVDIGGTLYSDAMGSEGTQEGTYIGMVRHNIDVIVNALV